MTHSRGPQHEQAIGADGQPEGTGWPGGWYVYENGRVDGPYSAADAFKLEAETNEGKPRLISRKGFTQWYALRDLSEIFKITEQMGAKTRDHLAITEAQLAGHAASATASPTPPPPVAAAAQGNPVKKQLRTTADVEAVRPVAPGLAVKPSIADLTYPSIAPVSRHQSLTPKSGKAAKKAVLMQEYFLARGRLRLGKMRNPWITSFVGLPLTIGTLWPLWMRDVSREVALHARNTDKASIPSPWLALVPVFHMVMTFKLAKLIVEMEAQNKYRSVSPTVAVLFSIFPPFAMAYLQDAVNRHWLLHVRHVVAKKRGSEA